MAQFDNVTYTYYSSTMGRSIIPSEDVFNKYKLENIQLVKRWLPYITELEENGIDKATCLMVEVDYTDAQTLNGEDVGSIASESVGGHSVSYGSAKQTKLTELNAKSTEQKKVEKLKLFCRCSWGVK